MEVTIKYSDEERSEALLHLNAATYAIAVDEVYKYCRSRLKHGLYDHDGKELELPDEAREYIFDMLEDIQGLVTEEYNLSKGW
jgi:hypothetical protein